MVNRASAITRGHGRSWYVGLCTCPSSYRFLSFCLDRVFYQGLLLFKHIRIYANASVSTLVLSYKLLTKDVRINDITVPYLTAAIELEDPFLGYEKTGLVMSEQPLVFTNTRSFINAVSWIHSTNQGYPGIFVRRLPRSGRQYCPKNGS
jgi:hypothetical protein